jgi:hypothetical protein
MNHAHKLPPIWIKRIVRAKALKRNAAESES